MQQLMVDYSVCQSAVKIAPRYRRIVRDFNAPPYQGKVAPGEIPPGYHYASDFYTLNAIENPRYQNVPQGTHGSGQQSQGNTSTQNPTVAQVDELMGKVTEIM
jgi:hypothetical protein